ncbi:MAG: ATPase V [Bacteroidales bacterium]|nr:ATPase V [Bacteroidales bacterium]
MIASMTKYSFILLNGQQDGFLEKLQEIGLVDITRSVKPADSHSHDMMGQVDLISGLISGLEKIDLPEDIRPEAVDGDLVRLTGGMLMRYTEDSQAIKDLRKEIDSLEVWGEFDAGRLQELSDAGVPVNFHVLPNKQFKPEWEKEYALTIVRTDKERTWFVVAGSESLPGRIRTPKIDIAGKKRELEEKETHFRTVLSRIAGAKERIDELKQRRAEDFTVLDRYLAAQAAVPAAEDTLVTFVGYVPTENEEAVTAAIDRMDVFYFKDKARVEDNPPISFRNNKFVRMFEVLTDMYGRPAYDGFDPTPFIAIFFLLFFAFCMGDAGYGLIMIGLGLLLRKVDSFKSFAPLVVTLGAATAVIGFLFHTFFSMDISTWKIFEPIKGIFLPSKIAGYDGAMVLALIVGILHLCLAMIVKTYNATKVKGFANSLGTWGWTLLIVGGTVVGALALVGVLDKAATKWIIIAIGVLSAVGIFLLNDLHRNPLINIGSGLWESYNTVTGLLGDVLSYLRLYALGLAGAMLGKAFNDIGMMVLGDGKSIPLWIPFILILLIGHTLNIAMCALGAFVHPLRLNFLEFFKNSGYEAAGRNYNPLKKTIKQ